MRSVVRLVVAGALVGASTLAWIGAASANHTQPIGIRCQDFSTQADAQSFLREHPYDPDGLDGPPGPNNDENNTKGVACEDLACPCDRTPVVYKPGNDAPTIPTSVPIVPGGLQPPDTAPPDGSATTSAPAGVVSGTTAPTRPGRALAAPGATSSTSESGIKRYRRAIIATAAVLVALIAYSLWLRRDRRKQYYPTSRPRWPTEW
ncbi:MAG TPA: hypothetical protein VFB78_14625 [Acidimicrobiales bacterium]|nr:hypothetical protein [Acidimicrobiales bacterium]